VTRNKRRYPNGTVNALTHAEAELAAAKVRNEKGKELEK
jgi:hypothetical protein